MGDGAERRRRTAARILAGGALCAAGWVVACEAEGPQFSTSEPRVPGMPATLFGATPPPRDDGRLPGGVYPFAYRLGFTIDPKATSFSGHTEIDVDVEEPTRAVVLHGRGMRISHAEIRTADHRKIAVTPSFRAAWRSRGEPEELVLTAADDVPEGPATLSIDYATPFGARLRGIYRVMEGDEAYAFSQFEPTDARLAFPCFDEPLYKTPFTVSVTTPDGNTAFANTREESRHAASQKGFVTIQFEPSLPLPTYLVALAVGPLETLAGQIEPTPLRVVATSGRANLGALALKAAGEQLPILEKYFRAPYPYSKLDFVAVPNFSAGAMENPGLITFREERLLVDPERASLSSRAGVYGVLAHEMSHLWFGDLVTMKWWDDLWLNEGFATWMATKVLDEWRPSLGAGEEAVASSSYAMRIDTLSSARRIRNDVRSTTEALEAFDGITYQKAAAVLGMAEQWIGKTAFQNGIADYLSRHRWGGAEADDLFEALAIAGKKDIPAVMYTFTEQTGVPFVDAELSCDPKHVELSLSQREYQPLGADGASHKMWRVPVCVRYGDAVTDAEACTVLDAPEKVVPLDTKRCPAWLYPNADQAGYYRSRTPLAGLEKLALLPPGKLTKRERVGLLADARALVESGNLDAADYLGLAARFRTDGDHVAWAQMADFADLLSTDIVPEDLRPKFELWVRAQAAAEAGKLGWDRRPKETENEEATRRTVLAMLGDAGDPAALAKARAVTEAWLAHPGTVDGDSATIAIPIAAAHGDAALYDRFSSRLKAPGTPEDRVLAITGLASFTEPPLVDRTLAALLDGTLRAQDEIYALRRLFRRPAVRARAFAFISAHADEWLEKLPSQMAGGAISAVSRGCSADEVKRADDLFRSRLEKIEGADRALAQALELDRRCAAFKEREEAPLRNLFGR